MDPRYVTRFEFRKRGDEMVGDVMAWRVEFVERRRPTVVRTLRGEDVPLEGSPWLDPLAGRVVKTLVKSLGTPDPGQPIPPPGSGNTLNDRLSLSIHGARLRPSKIPSGYWLVPATT